MSNALLENAGRAERGVAPEDGPPAADGAGPMGHQVCIAVEDGDVLVPHAELVGADLGQDGLDALANRCQPRIDESLARAIDLNASVFPWPQAALLDDEADPDSDGSAGGP